MKKSLKFGVFIALGIVLVVFGIILYKKKKSLSGISKNDRVNLVRTIKEMTHWNNHTGATLELAKFLNARREIKLLEAIETINDWMSSVPYELQTLRDGITKKLLQRVKEKYDVYEYETIRSAF